MARRHLTLMLTMLAATAMSGIAMAEPPGPDGSKTDNERLLPGLYPASPVPEPFGVPSEPGHPPFDLDWSVGLKGTYTSATTGNSFATTLNPQFTALHDGLRANLVIDGSAEIVKPWDPDGDVDISAFQLGISAVAPIDSTTTASGNAAIAYSQQPRTTPDLNPLIIVAPEVLSGSVGVGIDRSFGRFNLSARGAAERTVYGSTERTDTGLTDNSAQNLWALDSSLRLGFRATPIFEVFGEAAVGRDILDQPSALGVRSDATDLALRGGLSGQWNSTLAASASLGVGRYQFDEASLGEITTQLYDASITFTPDPTISIAARLNTTVTPVGADASGTARVSRTGVADLSYVVNSWLRLRASADWGYSELVGSPETEQSRGVGAGADYKVNSRTALSADYGFDHRDNSVTGRVDSHTVSLGVTLQR